MKKLCRNCGQDIGLFPDGSFVMHAARTGLLCKGTNCIQFENDRTVVICGVAIPIMWGTLDPDGQGPEEHDG